MLKKIEYNLLLVVMVFLFTSLYASHGEQYKEIDGCAIYLSILPAEMIGGHPKEHPESTMHSKMRLEGKNQHHIMVSLFDAKTGMRLQGATVKARVTGRDFNGLVRQLELMIMGNTQSYGNYFNVPKQSAYRVELEIKPQGKGKVINVVFQYAST